MVIYFVLWGEMGLLPVGSRWFFSEKWDLDIFGLHVGSPRTEIAPSPSWKMLETNVKYGKIMENTGKIREKHHLHIFFASWKMVITGLWELPRRTLIFPSSVQTRRPRDPENKNRWSGMRLITGKYGNVNWNNWELYDEFDLNWNLNWII